MCGIAGIISAKAGEAMPQQLRQMAHAIAHRGPDGEGFWQTNDYTVGLAHRRLAILDLSAAAAQPFQYGPYTLVYNGEIYNYKELKAELIAAGYQFRTHGDTEIIPAAYQHWGIHFLQKLDGMFAFALYDEASKKLLLARDRFGEKPLYFTNYEQQFFFASEMKALWAARVAKNIDKTMLLNYLTLGYVQNPANKQQTFFTGVQSLPPGHYIETSISNLSAIPIRWYQPQQNIKTLQASTLSETAAIERFSELFSNSVSRRLRSDVSVGTSLSGGLDSSSVVAAICNAKNTQKSHWSNVCFSAIFPGFEKDEYRYSKKVADNFGLQQYTVTPNANDLISHWQQLVHHQEEPFQSSSVLTQFMVYQLAKQQGITVLLDGQGADEILAGYSKYIHWYLQQLLVQKPLSFLKEKKLLQQHGMLPQWNANNYAAAFMPAFTARQLSKKANQQQTNHPYINPDFLQHASAASLAKPAVHQLEDILAYNSFQFGLEELLRYADRNSMAHSREVRLPFLNHELVEFIFSLPSHYKIRDGFTKWLLRKNMQQQLPTDIVWRTDKIGFEPPQQNWLQQPALKEMIMECRKTLVEEQILQPTVLHASITPKTAHEAANYDWRYLSATALF